MWLVSQAINYDILSTGRLRTNFSKILMITIILINEITFINVVCKLTAIFLGLNSSLPGQNGGHFADNFFKCFFFNEKFCILIQISLKFVPKGPTDNK